MKKKSRHINSSTNISRIYFSLYLFSNQPSVLVIPINFKFHKASIYYSFVQWRIPGYHFNQNCPPLPFNPFQSPKRWNQCYHISNSSLKLQFGQANLCCTWKAKHMPPQMMTGRMKRYDSKHHRGKVIQIEIFTDFFFPTGRHTETGRGWANGTRDSKFNLHTLPVRLFLLPWFCQESAVRKMSEFRLKWRETILERFIWQLWVGKEDENLFYIFQLRKSLLKIIKMGDSSYFVNFAKFINRLKWKASTPPWFNF